MKQFRLLLVLLFIAAFSANAQYEGPVEYSNQITQAHSSVNKKYLSYSSAVAHGKRARKIEKLRNALIDEVLASRDMIKGMKGYKDQVAYRDAAVQYMQTTYTVLDQDYAKLVNMEEIAEQSYDDMEAYLLIQEKADAKVNESFTKLSDAQKLFLTSFGVHVIEGKSEMDEKVEMMSKVNKYHHKVYMSFFKCNFYDGKLTEAMNAKNINAIEQNKNNLAKYAKEGLDSLAAMKSFEGDNSLISACKAYLQFCAKQTQEVSLQSDYLLKKDQFEQMKKQFEEMKQKDRTQADIDKYNKSVEDMNKASQKSNEASNNSNRNRVDAINEWNKASSNFLDEHTPVFK
jgi:hypothetical protein